MAGEKKKKKKSWNLEDFVESFGAGFCLLVGLQSSKMSHTSLTSLARLTVFPHSPLLFYSSVDPIHFTQVSTFLLLEPFQDHGLRYLCSRRFSSNGGVEDGP